MQHGIGCEYIHIEVDGLQLMIYYAAAVRRESRDHIVAACHGKPDGQPRQLFAQSTKSNNMMM